MTFAPPHRLGLAYAGSCREDVVDIIAQVLWDASTTFEVSKLY